MNKENGDNNSKDVEHISTPRTSGHFSMGGENALDFLCYQYGNQQLDFTQNGGMPPRLASAFLDIFTFGTNLTLDVRAEGYGILVENASTETRDIFTVRSGEHNYTFSVGDPSRLGIPYAEYPVITSYRAGPYLVESNITYGFYAVIKYTPVVNVNITLDGIDSGLVVPQDGEIHVVHELHDGQGCIAYYLDQDPENPNIEQWTRWFSYETIHGMQEQGGGISFLELPEANHFEVRRMGDQSHYCDVHDQDNG